MIKHVIMWNFKDELSSEERKSAAEKIKNDLEALENLKGVLKMKVYINPEPTSDYDVLLDSEFESKEALKSYQTHPAHDAVKNHIVLVRKERKCFDGSK